MVTRSHRVVAQRSVPRRRRCDVPRCGRSDACPSEVPRAGLILGCHAAAGGGGDLESLAVSARSFIAFLAVLAVVGLLVFGLLSKGNAKIAIGDPVPDKVLPALPGPGNGSIAKHRGDWVL